MITLYQFKHGLAAHKDIEEALLCSYIIMRACYEIKLALKLKTLGDYNNLIGGMEDIG